LGDGHGNLLVLATLPSLVNSYNKQVFDFRKKTVLATKNMRTSRFLLILEHHMH